MCCASWDLFRENGIQSPYLCIRRIRIHSRIASRSRPRSRNAAGPASILFDREICLLDQQTVGSKESDSRRLGKILVSLFLFSAPCNPVQCSEVGTYRAMAAALHHRKWTGISFATCHHHFHSCSPVLPRLESGLLALGSTTPDRSW